VILNFASLLLLIDVSVFSNSLAYGTSLNCDTIGTVVCKKFNERGKLMSSEGYRNGIRHGTWKYFEPNGNLSRKIKYKNGTRIWESFYKDNKLIETIDKRGRKKIVRDCGCH
jgi:antitoxin component YwqK of YwqJK toxin-antitoxin module